MTGSASPSDAASSADDSHCLLGPHWPSLSPLLTRLSNAVLVLDGSSEAGEALISALARSGDCPMTAVPLRWKVDAEWEQRMTAMGVHVDRSVESTHFAHDARRRLIAAHPRVFLHRQFRFDLWGAAAQRQHPVTGDSVADEMIDWLRACHYERARHVVYVSTASADVFRSATGCFESCHYRVEAKLKELHGLGGLQSWTILRPVTIMTAHVPSDAVSYTRVVARCSPDRRRQLIAGADVGRIAAHVFAQPSAFHGRTVELSGPDRLSSRQEAALRGIMTGHAVQCDVAYWHGLTESRLCVLRLEPWWTLPEEERRRPVRVEDTLQLLPDVMTYEAWFAQHQQAARLEATQAPDTGQQRCCTQ